MDRQKKVRPTVLRYDVVKQTNTYLWNHCRRSRTSFPVLQDSWWFRGFFVVSCICSTPSTVVQVWQNDPTETRQTRHDTDHHFTLVFHIWRSGPSWKVASPKKSLASVYIRLWPWRLIDAIWQNGLFENSRFPNFFFFLFRLFWISTEVGFRY